MKSWGLAATLQDAAILAGNWGPGCRIALGAGDNTMDIFAPAGLALNAAEAQNALLATTGQCFFTFGNQAHAPDMEALAAVMDCLIARSGIGFMAACFAAPALGRTVYQGHLFQDGKLAGNLLHDLSQLLSGRVAVIAHDIVAAGPAAIRARLAACREQGIALAVLDAVDAAQCAAIAAALDTQLLSGGPAWLRAGATPTEPAPPIGQLAIISGALDRQTLYQLGAARGTMPFLQLDFSMPGAGTSAMTWAVAQNETFIIAASAPPDRLQHDAGVAAILTEIAIGIAAQSVRRFVITGNDTAAAILAGLGVRNLTAGAVSGGLRWLFGAGYSFLLKPAGFGGRDHFLDGIEPQIRLNAAAE